MFKPIWIIQLLRSITLNKQCHSSNASLMTNQEQSTQSAGVNQNLQFLVFTQMEYIFLRLLICKSVPVSYKERYFIVIGYLFRLLSAENIYFSGITQEINDACKV